MEALIPASAESEVRPMIKFLNAQSIAPIENHQQLCQVYGHTRLDDQQISCKSSAERCLIIIHPIDRTSLPLISIFSYTSRNSCPVSVSIFRMTESRKGVSQCFQSQATDIYDTGYKSWSHGMTIVSVPEVIVLKNSSTLAVSVPINISIKLGLVSVNGLRETYVVDALRMLPQRCVTFSILRQFRLPEPQIYLLLTLLLLLMASPLFSGYP